MNLLDPREDRWNPAFFVKLQTHQAKNKPKQETLFLAFLHIKMNFPLSRQQLHTFIYKKLKDLFDLIFTFREF